MSARTVQYSLLGVGAAALVLCLLVSYREFVAADDELRSGQWTGPMWGTLILAMASLIAAIIVMIVRRRRGDEGATRR